MREPLKSKVESSFFSTWNLLEPNWPWDFFMFLYIPWRIHGAGIYANIKGVYWWDPCYHGNTIHMDPSWAVMGMICCFALSSQFGSGDWWRTKRPWHGHGTGSPNSFCELFQLIQQQCHFLCDEAWSSGARAVSTASGDVFLYVSFYFF